MQTESSREEIIKYSYTCDLCGREPISQRTCSICGRDMCSTCTKFDPRDMGDYPKRYCDNCFQIGEKYLEQISDEEDRCSAIIEELERKWRDEALSQPYAKQIKKT